MTEETPVANTVATVADVSNVVRFPKKNPRTPIDQTIIINEDIEEGLEGDQQYLREIVSSVCETYTSEIFFKLKAMGYNVDSDQFDTDIEFAQEALHSAMLRTFGIYHPIQDYIDDNFQLVSADDFAELKLRIMPETGESPSGNTSK